MQVELKVPEVGESITEGFLSCWLVPDGSLVRPDTEVFELETDKVTMPVPAGDSGRLQVLVDHGLLYEDSKIVRLTPRGRFFADEICALFYTQGYIPFPRGNYAEGPLNPYRVIGL